MSARAKIEARPLNVAGLVEYQNGAIVSREVLKKKTGTVTLFAFDAGQGLSEHTAPFDALIEIVEGTGTITIDGREYQVPTGNQIIMPANYPHAVRGDDRFKMVLVMIRSKKND